MAAWLQTPPDALGVQLGLSCRTTLAKRVTGLPHTRVCGQSGKPNQRCGDGNECFEPDIEFVVARSDTPEVLDTPEKPLDQVTTFIPMLIEISLNQTVVAGRNDRLDSLGRQVLNDCITVIGLVSTERPWP